jgi:hypothetical protein
MTNPDYTTSNPSMAALFLAPSIADRPTARALRGSDVDAVYVAHLIRDQTKEEIEAKAALDEIARRLVNSE